MKKNLMRALTGATLGGALAVAFVALSPTTASAYAEDKLMCTETQTRVVCCVVDGSTVKSCVVMPL